MQKDKKDDVLSSFRDWVKIKVFGIVEKFEVDAHLNFSVLLVEKTPMRLPFITPFRRESGTSQGMAELEKPMFCHRL